MSQQIQLRKGSASQWTSVNPILAQAEVGVETDTGKIKIGDGSSSWTALSYFNTGITDHGALTGLSDDDHSQYHNDARGDARYYTQSQSDVFLSGKESTGVAAGLISAHEAALDPHSQYLTSAEGNSAYESKNANIQSHISSTSNPHSVTKSQVGLGSVDNTSDLSKPISTATQAALDGKVDENAAITGATKTKISYDTKGLVTSGADATTADIADSLNKRYVTDAQLTVIGNTSGTNTGDQDLSGKENVGVAAGLISTHESTYTHSLIATAVQPGDNISDLFNDVGFLSSEADTLQTVVDRGTGSTTGISIAVPSGATPALTLGQAGSGTTLNMTNGGTGDFVVVDTNKFTLKNDGKLGLGIASPAFKFHISEVGNTSVYQKFTNVNTGHLSTDGFEIGIEDTGEARFNNREVQSISFYTSNTYRGQFTAGGTFAMDGFTRINAPNGSVTAPFYSFTHNNDAGMYRIGGSSNVSFSTSGVHRLQLDSAGNAIFGGITAALGQLHIATLGTNADTYPALVAGKAVTSSNSLGASFRNFTGSTGNSFIEIAGVTGGAARPAHIRTDSTGLLEFLTGSTTYGTIGTSRMKIEPTGNIGIATTVTPPVRLTIKASSSNGDGIRIVKTTDSILSTISFATASDVQKWAVGHSGTAVSYPTNNDLVFLEDGATSKTRLILQAGGNVGIGTTTPNANAILDITSTTRAFMPPRMTTVQKNAIASPASGMVVYDSTLNKLCVYGASAWETITSV